MFPPFRTWFLGATRHPVRTGELAGRAEPSTNASVRPAGRDFIVTSQASPVRWQPNREVRWELPVLKNPLCSCVFLNECACMSVCLKMCAQVFVVYHILSVNLCVGENVCRISKSPSVKSNFQNTTVKPTVSSCLRRSRCGPSVS